MRMVPEISDSIYFNNQILDLQKYYHGVIHHTIIQRMHTVAQVDDTYFNMILILIVYFLSLGVYQIMTSDGAGRPTTQYSGMSNNVNRRLNEHGYGGSDNLTWQMHQANYRGTDVRVRYAEADSALEARAQELYLLGQRDYNWNSRNNDGNVRYWWQ